MEPAGPKTAIVYRISASGFTIYDGLNADHELFLELPDLERILRDALIGLNLDYPLRTRSKVLKAAVCRALGYPVPERFERTRPRFPGQNFDTYVQKSNNLQIWNEEIAPSRRYVLVRVNEECIVSNVKVVTGETLARLDPTGALTQKFQAKARETPTCSMLGSERDTTHLVQVFRPVEIENRAALGETRPTAAPTPGALLAISSLYGMLVSLVGRDIRSPGLDQERNRGAALHRLVCEALSYGRYEDHGQFPDLMHQLLEVKLQTSPTIDLGLVAPNSTDPVADVPLVRHCDVRYAVFYATKIPDGARLEHVILTTGEDFFRLFQRFEGRVVNRKLQIPLPRDFFDSE
jgi:hypothetical protein